MALYMDPKSFSPLHFPQMDTGYHPVTSGYESAPHGSSSSGYPLFQSDASNAMAAYQQSAFQAFPPSRNAPFLNTTTQGSGLPTTQPNQPGFQSRASTESVSGSRYRRYFEASSTPALTPIGQPPRPVSIHKDWEAPHRHSPDSFMSEARSPSIADPAEYSIERKRSHPGDRSHATSATRYPSQRRPSNRDEFDGPHQLLDPLSPRTMASQERELPVLPTNLDVAEQDQILCEVNDRLSECAFNFVAKYQFPIPIEPDKRQVRVPADREWTEWVYLLKRLATKRRIPARVLYNGQIKQLVTVLENSLEMRHAAKHQSRPVKDDRNVLQLISAGTQVAKILKDATAMEYLDRLYVETENRIQERRRRRSHYPS